MNDLRLAFRSLARAPGFAFVIILTLALGIGANTAIFSFFRGILIRPLPFTEAERVVTFKKHARDFSDPVGVEVGFFAADYREMKGQIHSLVDLATYTHDSATLTGRSSSDLVSATVATPNFFSVLGSRAAVGRVFEPRSPDAPSTGGREAVLAHDYWQSHFGGDPALLGQSIVLNNVPFTVVGVMSPEFQFPREADLWVTPAGDVPEDAIGQPLREFGGRGNYLRTLIGRLQPGITQAQAEDELAAVVARLPNPNQVNRGAHLVNLRDHTVGDIRPVLTGLQVCVGLVLLIACLNVANLMLSRATARAREIGIRLAIGAGRRHIVRQLLSESLVLAGLGGLAGMLLSAWGLELLVAWAPDEVPRLAAVRLDGGVLAFALGVTLATGVLSGLVPVLGTVRSNLIAAARTGDRGNTGGGFPRLLRSLLVGGEVAISLVLLVAASLLLRSLARMQDFSWGFDPAHLVTARVAFLDERYREPAAQVAFYRTLLDRLAAVPGFDAVGTSLDRIGHSWIHLTFTPEGHVYPHSADRPQANLHVISPGYLTTMGISLRQGRPFTEHDNTESAPTIIVDENLAQRFFPEGNALGKRLRLPTPAGELDMEIIGITAAVKTDGPIASTRPDMYVPHLAVPANNFHVHVRTSLDPIAAGTMIRQVVHGIDPDVPVTNQASMREIVAVPAAARQFPLGLLCAFAALALLLAALGIYAVSAYGVTQRTREIGVRMALGAPAAAVIALVLRQGIVPIVLGLAAGLSGATIVALSMRGFLFGVQPLDLPTFLLVPILLAGIAAVACLVPARSATRVDPLIALRSE